MNQHRIEAAIIVQGYLLEILIGTIIRNQPNPLQTLEYIRFQIKAQLEDDLRFRQPVAPELKLAMDDALAAAIDRVAEQLTNPHPPRHSA